MSFPESDLHYFAGFVDADGYLGVCRNGGYLSPTVQATSVDSEHIELLHSIFGGNVYTAKPRSNKHRPANHLYWRGAAAIEIATELHPYLRLKKRQAELLILYPITKPFETLSIDLIKTQGRIYDLLRILNKKGT